MLTGEPMPVEKGVGAKVVGGTMNAGKDGGAGVLLCASERIGVDTLLAQIVAMVGAAQTDAGADTAAGG